MASEYKVVRMIYGKDTLHKAKEKYEHISSGGMNDVIKLWHLAQPERPLDHASPSKVGTCPRVVWLQKQGVPATNQMTWAVKQRMLLGRIFEDKFATQLKETESDIKLLHHWQDKEFAVDEDDKPFKFQMGEGKTFMDGVPDYLLQINDIVAISDAKTSRSDSFGYVEIDDPDIFFDGGWLKYKYQLTAYYMLCHANAQWFKDNNLPLPTHCHLFSYALDDGVVRRELLWKPTLADMTQVEQYITRFNSALVSETMPACTCDELPDNFGIKFCRYGMVVEGEKVCSNCCQDHLIERIKE